MTVTIHISVMRHTGKHDVECECEVEWMSDHAGEWFLCEKVEPIKPKGFLLTIDEYEEVRDAAESEANEQSMGPSDPEAYLQDMEFDV